MPVELRAMNTRITLRALALTALLITSAVASDHLDTQSVIDDPAGDIGDLYAWMSPDGRRLNLVMTIVGKRFSDHVRHTFRIDSGRAPGETSARSTIECDFDSVVAPDCRLQGREDRLDIARGAASDERGVESQLRQFRVFAGVRDDPFFNNVRGTRAALNVAAAALESGVSKDPAGCPRFDATTTQR